MKIALVHDWLTYFGGAEQVLKSFHRLFPEAPIYTLLYDKEKMERYFSNAKIRTSFLQKFPKFLQRRKGWLLPFLPTAPETFDLRDFDLVISSSNSFAKGIIIKPKTIHICYCHSPMRFVWDWHYNYLKEQKIGRVKKIFALPLLHYIRMWDKASVDRVDYFIANSKTTAKRIKKYYNKDSKVIYPPVDIDKFKVQSSTLPAYWTGRPAGRQEFKVQSYYLVVSRLSPYKRIDLAVKAFNKLGLPLIIIGEGNQKKYLQKIAQDNIKFLGFQPEKIVQKFYQNCQAFIFPGEEDFGITAVEAMATGCPVLAYRKGGLTETVIEGVTGEFFDDPVPEVLADGVRRIREREGSYDSFVMQKQAERFSRERFEREIKEFIYEAIN